MAGEALPETTNTLKALRYVQGQAAKGHFKGHPTALAVLYYLVMNMWAKPSGDAGPGEVMEGRADIGTIADCTALSRSSVQRALRWLGDEEWIDTQRQQDGTGREVHRYIYVKLDMPGHRQRERLRTSRPAPLRLVEGSREGVKVTHPGVAV